ncbi:MAG: MmgE/PrpD family protein [Candidatus Binataceae bacterium]
MTEAERLAAFVDNATFEQFSEVARASLKIRILDALGCAIGALDAAPMTLIRAHLDDFGGSRRCTLIGGGRSAPDRAALLNSALLRYLDFNDSYLAAGETCHPSDNLGPVLAAAEYAGQSGRDFLTALAVAYQVQCRLSDEAPVRAKGFDHVTQGTYAVAAGVSKALGLDRAAIANAVAIAGAGFNALRVTRTGALSNWKGLAYANMAAGVVNTTFLAVRGITGPLEVFEGNKGFMDAIAGHFQIDWSAENLERVTRTIVKKYNAEVHSQSALEGVLELKDEHHFEPEEIEKIEVVIFDVAYNIIGGGEEGEKTHIETKEQADHSLPYLIAVALLDGQVMPAQYQPQRIAREDVQALLRKITIHPSPELSARFPNEMPCRLTITLRTGAVLMKEKHDYEGFHTRPLLWESAVGKFHSLAEGRVSPFLRAAIARTVAALENIQASQLTRLLAQVPNNQG